MREKQCSLSLRFKFPQCVRSLGERETDSKHSRRLSNFRASVFALSVSCLVAACAGTLPLPPPAAKTNVAAPGSSASATELARTVVTPHSATDIQELYAKATADGQAKRYEVSASGFERAFQLDPVARVRALRILIYLEQYARAGELAESTAAKYKDLLSFDQLAVLAARALSRLAAGEDAQAEIAISKARDIIERESLDAAGRVPAELAPVYFALGELRRVRAERIHFVPVPENFGAALEQRCQLLLDAQSAYSDAMRAYDSHWSAMAGYRVGELYQKLHEEMMQVPPPQAANTERRRQLFEGAMRLRYSILLDKAKSMLDHTVAMAERTGEQSPWVLKSRQARDAIAKSTEEERQALARLPYTRAQLQEALDSFAAGRAPP